MNLGRRSGGSEALVEIPNHEQIPAGRFPRKDTLKADKEGFVILPRSVIARSG